MGGVFVPPGKQIFLDPITREPIALGTVTMYIPSTTTFKDTFSDQAEGSLNTNPIDLDMNGECIIWGNGLYRQVLKREDGSVVWDQITGFDESGMVVYATPEEVAALTVTDKAISPGALGASGLLPGYGMHYPLSQFGQLSLDGATVGDNDTILTAAQASSVSLHFATPYGIIRTNLTKDQLTKGYTGDAGFITGPGAGDGAFRPPNFAFMAVKPTTWPVQGDGGFWRGDQRFTDNGEWKIIGPGVRTYDTTDRYFESNTIPHPAWLDVNSGGSGVDGFLTSGALAGASVIALNGAASVDWIGKSVAFAPGPDQVATETHTVSNVAGNNIDISPAVLANNYVWNPGAGQVPCIYFGKRTFAGMGYVKIRDAGAGDCYGDVVRQNLNYTPLATQYHSFMAQTGGQYGGDVYFNSDGVYGQFFESQLQGQTYDVTAIGFVGSFVRNKDYALDGGKFWAGSWFQSTGTRPADAGHVLLGNWRNGLDTVFANLYETSRLTAPANPTDTVITVASVNGAHPGDTLILGSETCTIDSINAGALQITLSAGLVGTYATGDLVTYPKGGAALNMAHQRVIWNSSLSINARSGDPTGVFATLYGNVQGDLIEESGVDGISEYWSIRFARGPDHTAPDTARIRLRPDGINVYAPASGLGVTGKIGATDDIGTLNDKKISFGTGTYLIYHSGPNVIELFKNSVSVATW